MAVFYRIVGAHRAATALDGEGARKMGGRWNPRGVPVVYLAESRALAALEIMVHFGRDVALASWVVIGVEVPDAMIDSHSLKQLPTGWDDMASSSVSRAYGANWVNVGKSLSILLPSAVIPEERSMMINVSHESFSKIKATAPVPFYFDPRLGKA
jgi:RES domain-containing protein